MEKNIERERVKTCTKCGEEKPISEFYWSNKSAGYKRADCKKCSNKQLEAGKKEWLKQNPNKTAEYSRRHREKNLESRRAQKRACDDRNRDRVNKYNKAYRERMPDAYIINTLRQKRGFTKDQITPELITAHRALIQLKRAIKGEK